MKHFSADTDPKIACQCGECGLGFDDMDRTFMLELDGARENAGVPFRITSGIRCPDHNQAVSNTGANGPHTTGKAVDIAATGSRERFKILEALLDYGFHRIGVGSTFIHVDDDESKDPQVVWLYD